VLGGGPDSGLSTLSYVPWAPHVLATLHGGRFSSHPGVRPARRFRAPVPIATWHWRHRLVCVCRDSLVASSLRVRLRTRRPGPSARPEALRTIQDHTKDEDSDDLNGKDRPPHGMLSQSTPQNGSWRNKGPYSPFPSPRKETAAPRTGITKAKTWLPSRLIVSAAQDTCADRCDLENVATSIARLPIIVARWAKGVHNHR